ncbi:uncharacterized protein [Haliotis asinina]|uniref:uncharacterized protein n=1 Tax=Haliotis asinina TaxID=109174 RepID=UPI003531E472
MAVCAAMKTHGLLFLAITSVVLCPTVEGLVIREGENASLSWNQPDPPVREFSILKSDTCIFKVSNYDNIAPCTSRVMFTGNVTSEGHGVFSFVLVNVTLDDGGRYTCNHGGSTIAHCGKELHVLDVPATCGLSGEPLSVSWNLPNPGVKEFTVMMSGECFFHIVNYNQVTKCGNLNGHFTGNITQSGNGVFSFDLPPLESSYDGYFRCYVGPPNSSGSRIPACGQEVSVIYDLQHPYIARPDTIPPGEPLTLTCHFTTAVIRIRYHHIIASFSWRRNGVVLETGYRYKLTSQNSQWDPRVRYYIGYLTIRDVGAEAGTDSYTCEAVLDHSLSTEQSDAVTIGKTLSTDLYKNRTLARERENAAMVWKLPLDGLWHRIKNPRSYTVMSAINSTTHVWQSAWSKIRITGIIVFPDSRALLLTMYNVMLRDAGHYRCIPARCDTVLVVQKRPSKPTVVQGNMTFTCSSTAKSLPKEYRPPLSYIWRRNRHQLQLGGGYWMDGPHLFLPYNTYYGGKYSCQSKEGSLTSLWSDSFTLEGKDVRKEDQGGYSCRTEQQISLSDWSETIQVTVLADQSPTTAVVAGACTAVLACAAIIFTAFLLQYKKMKRSLEERYIPREGVRMSDIVKSDTDDAEYYALITD